MFLQLEKKNIADQEVRLIMKNGPGSPANIDIDGKGLIQQSLMFETPSAQIVEDSKVRIRKKGCNEKQFYEIRESSETYAQLRQLGG